MAKLIFIGPPFDGRAYELCSQRTSVGRAEANTLTLSDASVSEQHAEIYDNGADVIIRDLGSRNGTVVNGALIRKAQRPLAAGQEVAFGGVQARLEVAARSSVGETATDVTAVHYRPPAPAPVRPPHISLTPDDAGPASSDNTLFLPRESRSPVDVAPVAPQPAQARSVTSWHWLWWLVGVVMVGSAAVMAFR